MISIRRIEKFLEKHPELWEKKYPILGRADKVKDQAGNIHECFLGSIFNDVAVLKLFCDEEIGVDISKQMTLDDLSFKFRLKKYK